MDKVVTFLSDFGLRDAYVAQVKGVLLAGCPGVTVVDLSHAVDAFGVLSGAWLLFTSYGWFAPGSLHLAVVDPGVGTRRDVLIVRKGGHTFVGPDNGIFSFIYPDAEVWRVDWRPEELGGTFHGRDVFAPLVVRLLNGAAPAELGVRGHVPLRLDIERPLVVHCDIFGNVVTNIAWGDLVPEARLRVGGVVIEWRVHTYGDIPAGGLALLRGSAGTVEVAGNRLSAADRLKVEVGDGVELLPA